MLDRCKTGDHLGTVAVMADEPRLSPAAYERLTERAQELGLLEDPDTLGALRCINPSRPRSLDRKLFSVAEDRVTRFAQHRRDLNPFATPRPPANSSGLLLGTEFATQRPIFATSRDLSRHTLITAPTGGTKTVYAHQLILQGRAHGLHAWIADPKLDAQYLAARDEDFLIISRDAPFNLLQPLPFVPRAQHIQLVAHCFAKTHYGGEHTTQVLEIALTKAYEQYPVPCFADVLAVVETLAPKGSTYGWADAVRGVQHKLWRLRDQYPVSFTTRHCNLHFLFSRSLYLPLLFQSTSDEFVLAVLAHLLFLHHYHAGIRQLDTLLLYDEGLTSWSSRPANIDQAPILANLQVQLREMGLGMLVTTASVSMTSSLLKSNVFVRVTMGAGNPADLDELTRTFQFTTEQRDYFTKRITPGQAIVKVGTDIARLVTFPDLPHNKTVAPSTWDAALRRTDILRPTPPLQLQPKPARDRVTAHPPAAPRVAPATNIARNTISYNTAATQLSLNTQPVANNVKQAPLNERQRTLLTFVAQCGVATVMETNDALGLQPMQADRERKKLGPKGLGLLTETRITVGSGRGKQALALMASDLAYNLLGLKRPHLGRGSGPQHAWCLRALRERIAHAAIEGLGAADVAFVFDGEDHAQFLHALRSTAHDIVLSTGDTVALEVELTTKHLATNLARNARNGFALTITLTLPAEVLKTRRCVQRLAVQHPVVVIDAFRFLDALRTTEAT
jgi:hypothetical protein